MISSHCLSSLHVILFRTVLVAVLEHLTGDDSIYEDFFVGQACSKSQLGKVRRRINELKKKTEHVLY
jgi:hypothetical protein